MHFSRWWGSFHLLTVFFLNSLFCPCPFDQDCCPFTKQTVYRWALDTNNCIIIFFLCMFAGDNTFPWNALNMTGRWDLTEGLSLFKSEELHILIWPDIIVNLKVKRMLRSQAFLHSQCIVCRNDVVRAFPACTVFHLFKNVFFFTFISHIKASLSDKQLLHDGFPLAKCEFSQISFPLCPWLPVLSLSSQTPTQATDKMFQGLLFSRKKCGNSSVICHLQHRTGAQAKYIVSIYKYYR